MVWLRRLLFASLSLVVHAALARQVERIRVPPPPPTTVPITMAEAPPPPPPTAAPPPPTAPPPPAPPSPEPARPRPRRAPPAEALPPPPPGPAAQAAGATDLGDLALSGASGPGGVPVPVAGPASRTPPPPTRRPPRPAVRANPPPSDPGCESPPVKPKPLSAPLPEYPASARAAGLVGRARVSVTVDATGRVVDVRLVEGPGGELDEAALTAVRRWTFEPGTRCGMPESATFTVRVSFVP